MAPSSPYFVLAMFALAFAARPEQDCSLQVDILDEPALQAKLSEKEASLEATSLHKIKEADNQSDEIKIANNLSDVASLERVLETVHAEVHDASTAFHNQTASFTAILQQLDGSIGDCNDEFGALDTNTSVVDLDAAGGCGVENNSVFVHYAGGQQCQKPTPPPASDVDQESSTLGCHRYVAVKYNSKCLPDDGDSLVGKNAGDGNFNNNGVHTKCAGQEASNVVYYYRQNKEGTLVECSTEQRSKCSVVPNIALKHLEPTTPAPKSQAAGLCPTWLIVPLLWVIALSSE